MTTTLFPVKQTTGSLADNKWVFNPGGEAIAQTK